MVSSGFWRRSRVEASVDQWVSKTLRWSTDWNRVRSTFARIAHMGPRSVVLSLVQSFRGGQRKSDHSDNGRELGRDHDYASRICKRLLPGSGSHQWSRRGGRWRRGRCPRPRRCPRHRCFARDPTGCTSYPSPVQH
eukprot:3278117-Pyramimonas_sp.AAC.1